MSNEALIIAYALLLSAIGLLGCVTDIAFKWIDRVFDKRKPRKEPYPWLDKLFTRAK